MLAIVLLTAQRITNESPSSFQISDSNLYAFILSVVSILISSIGILYIQTYEIRKTQEEDRQTRKHKAILSAALIKKYLPNDRSEFYLKVTNSGEGKAKEIAFSINGNPASSDNRLILDRLFLSEFNELESGSEFYSRELNIGIGSNMNFHVRLTWSDDSGETGVFDQRLTPVVETA